MPKSVAYIVYRQRPSQTYGVYRQPAIDGTGQELVEGGFFRRAAAQAEADRRNAAAVTVCGCGATRESVEHASWCAAGRNANITSLTPDEAVRRQPVPGFLKVRK